MSNQVDNETILRRSIEETEFSKSDYNGTEPVKNDMFVHGVNIRPIIEQRTPTLTDNIGMSVIKSTKSLVTDSLDSADEASSIHKVRQPQGFVVPRISMPIAK